MRPSIFVHPAVSTQGDKQGHILQHKAEAVIDA